MKIEVTWEVTETHRMVVDRGNLEEFASEELDSDFLAEWEGNNTYLCTTDRVVTSCDYLAPEATA